MNYDTSEFYCDSTQYNFVEEPTYTWRVEFFGLGPNGITMQIEEKRVPNWFWRTMQYLVFGNKYYRIKEKAA